MKRITIGSMLAGMSAALCLAVPAQAQNKSVDFTVYGDAFTVPVPSGYCVPTGAQAEQDRITASWDSQNVTPVNIQHCERTTKDYFLIKSPRNVPALDMTRPEFIALMSAEFDTGSLEEGFERGESDVSNGTGGAVQVKVKEYAYTGSDDVCVYLSGVIGFTNAAGSGEARAASCMTIVGRRNLVVHAYDFNPQGASVDQLRARSRRIAASIKAK